MSPEEKKVMQGFGQCCLISYGSTPGMDQKCRQVEILLACIAAKFPPTPTQMTEDKEKNKITHLYFTHQKNNSGSGLLWSKETYSQSEQSTTKMGSEVTWKRALSIIYNEAFRHKVNPGLFAQLSIKLYSKCINEAECAFTHSKQKTKCSSSHCLYTKFISMQTFIHNSYKTKAIIFGPQLKRNILCNQRHLFFFLPPVTL